jgi:predicted DNA-binding transcriptional regulator YafY
MPQSTVLTQLDRLDDLADLLADASLHTLSALGETLAVSPRTVARDIAVLRSRGMVIEGALGPGGGVCLKAGWPSTTSVLRESEAMELLLALSISEAMGLSMQPTQLASIRARLAKTFAPADKSRISQLRLRVRVASPVRMEVRATQMPEEPTARHCILNAFFRMQVLWFDYTDASLQSSRRQVEPHYLVCAWPFWYVVAWDTERQAIRTFRMDRIKNPQLAGLQFRLKSSEPFWRACNDVGISL